MLTGFHGMHVTLGTIMLIVMFLGIVLERTLHARKSICLSKQQVGIGTLLMWFGWDYLFSFTSFKTSLVGSGVWLYPAHE